MPIVSLPAVVSLRLSLAHASGLALGATLAATLGAVEAAGTDGAATLGAFRKSYYTAFEELVGLA